MTIQIIECDEWGPVSEEEYEYEEFDLDDLSPEEFIKVTTEQMLDFLMRSYLEVGVNQEACIRIVINMNTQWYQDF